MIWQHILVLLIGYGIGNISFARLISARRGTDITKQGSGNPGSMNMLRTFGFKLGMLNLVLDALKGVVASLIGFFVFGGNAAGIRGVIGIYVGGLGAVLGHNFPVAYKFKGGKGVACILGVFAVAEPLWSLVAFAISFVYLYFFDYGAVASFLFITILTVLQALKYGSVPEMTVLLFIMFFLTWFMHRKNIDRLLWGKERGVNLAKAFKKKRPKKD